MISIKLKSFQEEAIANILEQFESVDGSRKMIVKAPTGSGKTITLIGLIERFVTDYAGQYVFCWLTPGKGELEEQSKEKMDRFSPSLYSGTLFDVLTSGFNADTTYFINWESITKKETLLLKRVNVRIFLNKSPLPIVKDCALFFLSTKSIKIARIRRKKSLLPWIQFVKFVCRLLLK